MGKEKKKKRNLKNIVINILIFLLFVVGIALVFNKDIRNVFMNNTTTQYQVKNISNDEVKKNQKADVSFDFDKVKSVNIQDVMNSQFDRKVVDNLPVVGGIAIPDLSLNLPIFKGVDNVALFYGAGTMKENQVMGQGNYALASHYVSGYISNGSNLLFSPLERAKVGMKIYLTDMNKIYEYEVSDMGVFDPSRVDLIEDVDGEKTITLVTCSDLAASDRRIVFGKYVKEYDTSKASQDVTKAFDTSFNSVD
ncbi:class A sortase [Floricoccus penangensis]|uniref:class A sortase n=1 Tax=Floricoccus penangensis TaxID=1859475 RepID=UPI00203D7FED|nr:class A sortase [Floricoccus penangensis]URZ86734.1 class A sortase [Floricoccus penangensis]